MRFVKVKPVCRCLFSPLVIFYVDFQFANEGTLQPLMCQTPIKNKKRACGEQNGFLVMAIGFHSNFIFFIAFAGFVKITQNNAAFLIIAVLKKLPFVMNQKPLCGSVHMYVGSGVILPRCRAIVLLGWDNYYLYFEVRL
jgi:hypothetical protein